jgi:hypothetical protein
MNSICQSYFGRISQLDSEVAVTPGNRPKASIMIEALRNLLYPTNLVLLPIGDPFTDFEAHVALRTFFEAIEHETLRKLVSTTVRTINVHNQVSDVVFKIERTSSGATKSRDLGIFKPAGPAAWSSIFTRNAVTKLACIIAYYSASKNEPKEKRDVLDKLWWDKRIPRREGRLPADDIAEILCPALYGVFHPPRTKKDSGWKAAKQEVEEHVKVYDAAQDFFVSIGVAPVPFPRRDSPGK